MRSGLRHKDYDRLFVQGKRFSSGPFRLLFLPSLCDCPRIGFIVPKRFLRRAVDRNRVKRVVREVWRCHRVQHSLMHLDMIVQLYRPIHGVFLPSFGVMVERLFRDAF